LLRQVFGEQGISQVVDVGKHFNSVLILANGYLKSMDHFLGLEKA